MSVLTKVLIVLNVIMSLIYFAFTAALFSYRVDYKNKLIMKEKEYIKLDEETKKEINRLMGELNSRDEKINQLEKEIGELKVARDQALDQLQTWQNQAAQLQNDITRLTNNLDKVTADLNTQINKNAELQRMVDEFRDRQQTAEHDLNTMHARLQETEDKLIKAEKNLRALEEQYIELSKELTNAKSVIDHYKRVYKLPEPVGPPKIITGKVLAVSHAHNIVIISVGRDAGVEVGMEFTVYRGANYIGKIRVDKVDKDHSSALTIENMMKDRIMEGDEITTSPY